MTFFTKTGIKIFSVIYNVIALVGVAACINGYRALAFSSSALIGREEYAQSMMVILTVLFFASSFLLTKRHMAGIYLSIFLVTFLISAGFFFLIPLLILHICFFMLPDVHKHFHGLMIK